MKLFLFFIIVLLLAGFLIISNNQLKMDASDNMIKFTKTYVIWIGSFFQNIATTTANVISIDTKIPSLNETNSS